MSVLIVTGTGTEVGKTVVTAAVAALAAGRGTPVAVVKAAQTGVAPGDLGDVDLVRDLAGVGDGYELARYPEPLAPATAARRAGLPTLDLIAAAEMISKLADETTGSGRAGGRGGPPGRPGGAASRRPVAQSGPDTGTRLVLVEGAGGLLVRYDEDGRTLADLARLLHAPVLVVTRPALGTLNDTALTLEALAHRGLAPAGVVIGSWPAEPGLAERANLADLEAVAGRPIAGALPAGAGLLDRASFRALARRSLAPALGGTFDPAAFRALHAPALPPPGGSPAAAGARSAGPSAGVPKTTPAGRAPRAGGVRQ